ncbi:MAG: hypothetical protein ABJF67_17780 [Aurantimonas coralicida]|jgi:hypothetical protein|uniref:Uncharacterized protein n=1 Tax=Jiella pelagia TaxID=2986949 RepID=A0ABY7BXE7_9HYPH|nr:MULTISPECIES: hypothetical protein [Aurantimonadaceae]MBC6717578.1 hypothetical protein [Aurantimonas sp. DM33-3]MCC4299077.1 hypothetical protein [Aurantimonas coralicida]WAP68388.1 hypothetical protein OH818_24170 [Jiella pelagia]
MFLAHWTQARLMDRIGADVRRRTDLLQDLFGVGERTAQRWATCKQDMNRDVIIKLGTALSQMDAIRKEMEADERPNVLLKWAAAKLKVEPID